MYQWRRWNQELTGGKSLEQALNGDLDSVDDSEDVVQEVKDDLEVDNGQLADGGLEKGLNGSLNGLDLLADGSDGGLDVDVDVDVGLDVDVREDAEGGLNGDLDIGDDADEGLNIDQLGDFADGRELGDRGGGGDGRADRESGKGVLDELHFVGGY